jgi:hypothetical protein
MTVAPKFYHASAQTLDTADVDFDALLRSLDAQCAAYAPDLVERYCFPIDGVGYEVRRIGPQTKARYVISAPLGYMPFSIESSDRRQAVKAILAATKSLPTVRFATDQKSKITVGGVFDRAQPTEPDFVFYPLMQFLQEARPFVRLLKQYL